MDDISFRWLDFNDDADEILAMREEIFVKEYGMNRITTMSPKDESGIHLAMYHQRTLLGVVTGYLFDRNDITVSQYELPVCEGIYFQVAKLAVRSTNRVYAPGLCLLYALISGVSEQITFDMLLTFLYSPQFKQASWYSPELGFDQKLIRRYNYYHLKIMYGYPNANRKPFLNTVGLEANLDVPFMDDKRLGQSFRT